MTTYVYKNILPQPDIEVLRDTVSVQIQSGVCSGFNWNEGCNRTDKSPCNKFCSLPCRGILVAYFESAISDSDKTLLDSIIAQL